MYKCKAYGCVSVCTQLNAIRCYLKGSKWHTHIFRTITLSDRLAKHAIQWQRSVSPT